MNRVWVKADAVLRKQQRGSLLAEFTVSLSPKQTHLPRILRIRGALP
jgi:hypothetical protein